MEFITGGFKKKINILDFKYTLDDNRKLWTINMYPILSDLIKCVKQIPWDSYSYSGNAIISYEKHDEDNGESIEVLDIEKTFKVVSTPLKYNFFGGICYELISDIYKNVELSWFVDPTGDIDINSVAPEIEPNEEILESAREIEKSYPDANIIPEIRFFAGKNKTINPYYKHLITWIYEKVKAEIKDIDFSSKIPDLVDFDIDDYEHIPIEHKRAEMGFMHMKLKGGGHLVSYVELPEADNSAKTMAKIQLVFKVKKNNVEIVDHVMEIVVTNQTMVPGTAMYDHRRLNTMSLKKGRDEYIIQSFTTLVSDNIDSYGNRKQFLDKSERKYYHKALNHVGRLLYLFDLAKHNLKDPLIKSELQSMIIGFFYSIRKLYLPESNKMLAKLNKQIPAGTSAVEIKKIKEANRKRAYAEVAETYSFHFYRLDVEGEFAQRTDIISIRIVDLLIAYLDVFKEYKMPLDIFNEYVVHATTREISKKYEDLIGIIKSNVARPILQNVVREIKQHHVVEPPKERGFVKKPKAVSATTTTTPAVVEVAEAASVKPKSKTPSPKTEKTRRKRCPNGTRRNKKTGECEPVVKN